MGQLSLNAARLEPANSASIPAMASAISSRRTRKLLTIQNTCKAELSMAERKRR